MSSGAARQNDQNNKDSFRAESNPTTPALFRQRGDASAPLATGTGFAAPRVGALLVEAYGKAVRKQLAFSPDTVQLEYIRFLIKSIDRDYSDVTGPQALELRNSVSSSPPATVKAWPTDLKQSIHRIIANHTVLADDPDRNNRLETLLLAESTDEADLTSDNMAQNTFTLSTGFHNNMGQRENNLDAILSDVGPSCTRSPASLRDILQEVSTTNGPMNEASLALLIYFFSDKTNAGPDDQQSSLLSSALLSSILAGRGGQDASGTGGWNLKVVAQVLSEDYADKDWITVARMWDMPRFRIKDVTQFRTLMDLYRAGSRGNPPLSAFTANWMNGEGQLSVLECIAATPSSLFSVSLNEEETNDAAVAPPPGDASAPNVQFWASFDVLQRLLSLSDNPTLYRRVRDLFVKCLLSCPEVLLCSLVRFQLSAANAAAQGEPGSDVIVNTGLQIKAELMRELIPLFFRPNGQHRVQNGPAALRRLFAISSSTVTAACYEAWRHTAGDLPHVRYAGIMHIINIARLLPSPTDAVASLLSGSKDAEFSIAVAFVMADNDYLQLKPWLNEKLSSKNTVGAFAVALVSFLRKNFMTAGPRSGPGLDGSGKPFVSIENIAVSLQILQSLDPALLNQNVSGLGTLSYGTTLGENIKSLIDVCVGRFPSVRGVLAVQNRGMGASGGASVGPTGLGMAAASEDVEEMATAYFQKIYTSEQSIGEVVEMLKRFKSSGNSKENEIFACMVHNLFDEYRFFSKYPEKELRITGILFGALIQEQLVSEVTLGIALRYVLEALRKPPSPPGTTTSGGKMFKFGMFALEQYKRRLHEWPQYCSHIVQIPHLKEGYGELLAEIELEMTKSQARAAAASSGSAPPQPIAPSAPLPAITSREIQLDSGVQLETRQARVAEFGPKLGRAVTDVADADKEFEAPPDAMLDRVQFLVNNLAPSNVEQKAKELKEMLEPKYFGWLGHFLVVKRISTQANFHSLYLSFLDNLGEYGRGLTEAILSSVYHNIGKLLRSPKITTSSSERSYLKNLGIWLGQITLAKNRPILQIMLDCKELLLQGYETGKLIAVAPFLAKTIEGGKNSIIFRPPNPWVMGILAVFRSVYNVDGLKMNIKFEVEVLCKNLGIKLEEIPLRNNILGGRIPPVKERNPDFNIKPSGATQPKTSTAAAGLPSVRDASTLALPSIPSGTEGARSNDQQETLIPNLAAYVTVNPNLTQLLQSQGGSGLAGLTFSVLKRVVPIALDRAIREIIQPVVERSVTIACITTKEIVLKDFAMEGDEGKLRKAGQLMVANLAGSLALVTCREPLRSSVSTHLRQLLTSSLGRSEKLGEQEQNVIEQCVQICATDNLELGCMLIEKAATEKAVREVEEALASAVTARRKHREQTGQPFYDMSIFSNGNRFPASLPEALRPKPGNLTTEHYQLYESFQRQSGQAVAAAQSAIPAASGSGLGSSRNSSSNSLGSNDMEQNVQAKPSGGHPFGSEVLNALAAKLDSAVSSILSVAGSRAREIKLDMLPADHQIRQLLNAVSKVMPNAGPTAEASRHLTTAEHEIVLTFSQGVFKRLYELSLNEPLRLEALVSLLENINVFCPKLGKDMGTWATYAPTNTEQQRRLHRTVLLLLVRSRLLSVHDLDTFLAARADSGRNPIWVEFSLLFIRTAFLERIASPADFPKLIDLMTKIADGRSQAPPQVLQRYQKPIGGMLDEMRPTGLSVASAGIDQQMKNLSFEENSSLSRGSLATLGLAASRVAASTESFARTDSPKARQQVNALLESWIRLQTEPGGNETTVTQYLQVLQQLGIGRVEDQTERFFRLSLLTVVDAVLNNASGGDGSKVVLNYTIIDMYSRLLVAMFRHLNTGGSSEQVDKQRLSLLNKILGVSVRTMMWHCELTKASGKGAWDQRPWFRLFLNLVIDTNKPDPAFESIRLAVLSLFGAIFHVCQPLVMPGFAFAWLELVSHRHFLPNVLLYPGQVAWNVIHQLLVDHLLFLEPYLRRIDLLPPIKKLYEGTLRVILMLLHDFPSFLAAYHISFCNVIPDSCIQLRNILLSATPKGMSPPDPFTPNLKIDLLTEISSSPTILSNVLGPIEPFKTHLDAFLKDGQHKNFLNGLLPLLLRDGTSDADVAKVNSLVVYVGAHALARLQSAQISLSRTPEIEIIQKLMDFDDKGRYTAINAIANQLRYPSSHTHYFSCVMLFLFGESKSVAVKEQITRVLLERLIVNRPHPWGLLITFIELIKNQRYGFWNYPFTRCATEIEKVFESVARSCMPPGGSRSGMVGGGLEDQ